jgi:DNA/RNA-binding domain of Phe-tRNA-synthetase-like protein
VSPAGVDLRIDPGLQPLLRVATLHAAPVRVRATGPALREAIRATEARLLACHAGRTPAEIPALGPARELYRAFGIDPTRTRPSSEALLRRVLGRRGPFPEILDAVDIGNLCALLFLLPIGLYDRGRLSGPVTLRRGAEGESYAGIRKDVVHLTGRPTLADATGPFGNPTSDSLRTAVTTATTALWMVIFAPRSVTPADLAAHLDTARGLVTEHLRGQAPVDITTTLLDPA